MGTEHICGILVIVVIVGVAGIQKHFKGEGGCAVARRWRCKIKLKHLDTIVATKKLHIGECPV